MQGSYGAWLQGGSNNTLRGLRLRDLGSGGMRIGEGSIPSAQNSIVDCSIRDGGHVFFAGAGIHATRTDGNLIEGNTIAGFAASGVIIRIGAGNMISNNRVMNLGLGLLSDLGGVCLSYGTQGSVAEGNQVGGGFRPYNYGGHGMCAKRLLLASAGSLCCRSCAKQTLQNADGCADRGCLCACDRYSDMCNTGSVFRGNRVSGTATAGYQLHYGWNVTVTGNHFGGKDPFVAKVRQANTRSF